MINSKVTLSQADLEFIQSLSPELQAAATTQRLQAKERAKAAYLNDPNTVARLERNALNRSTFRTVVTPRQGLSVYGLKQRFPVTLSKDGWMELLSHAEEIKAALAPLPARMLPKSKKAKQR